MKKQSILVGAITLGAFAMGTSTVFAAVNNENTCIVEATCADKKAEVKTTEATCGNKKTEMKTTEATCGNKKTKTTKKMKKK